MQNREAHAEKHFCTKKNVDKIDKSQDSILQTFRHLFGHLTTCHVIGVLHLSKGLKVFIDFVKRVKFS